MKKSLIALAVAGAMTAPVVAQADATLYGNVEVEAIFAEDADADVQVDDARIGVKGSDETYIDGVSSIYQIELEFNPEDTIDDGDKTTVRLAYAGLTGGFGTALAGRIANPVDATESLDMYSESVSTDYYFKNPDRLGNSIAYVSPTFSGLSVYAAIVMEGASGSTRSLKDGNATTGLNGNPYDDGDREDLDGYLVGADFEMAGFTANLGYWEFDGEGDVLYGPEGLMDDDMSMWSLSLGYTWNALSFLLNYQETENYLNGAYADNLKYGVADTTTWALGAEYALGNTTLGITYMDYEEEEVNCTAACGSDIEADEWGVYVSHALSKKASLKAQYSSADSDDTLYSEDILTLGYNVKF
jgi:predicted porin